MDKTSPANIRLDVSAPPSAPYPAFATIAAWQRLSGMSRSRTYQLLAAGDLKAVKLRNRTLIDVGAGLAWMRTLPAAMVAKAERPTKETRGRGSR